MKYAQVEAMESEHAVWRICALFGVAPSGYYAWRQHEASPRARQDVLLLKAIQRIFVESHEIYGSPRIHAALRQEGHKVSRKRVERLMRTYAIRPHTVKKAKGLSKRAASHRASPNLVAQQFRADHPNQIWLVDSTEFETQTGKLYLAVVEDLFSRRIIGWTTGSRFNKQLVVTALKSALAKRKLAPKQLHTLIHHSDQGAQYTSDDYRALLVKHKIRVSMSDVGNCFDNAPMESFIGSLKEEWTRPFTYRSRAQLANDLFDYIEGFYNLRRLHSSIAYVSPATFETRYYAQQKQQQRLLEGERQRLTPDTKTATPPPT